MPNSSQCYPHPFLRVFPVGHQLLWNTGIFITVCVTQSLCIGLFKFSNAEQIHWCSLRFSQTQGNCQYVTFSIECHNKMINTGRLWITVSEWLNVNDFRSSFVSHCMERRESLKVKIIFSHLEWIINLLISDWPKA